MATLANSGNVATSLDNGSFSVFVGLKLTPAGKAFGWKGKNRTLAYNKAMKLVQELIKEGKEIIYVLNEDQIVVGQVYKKFIVQQKIGAIIKKKAAQKLTKSALLECFEGLDLDIDLGQNTKAINALEV